LNKTKTYLLIFAVLSIWGTIGFKIMNGLSPDKPKIIKQESDVDFKPKLKRQTDTFSIQQVDRDPFLGSLTSNRIKVNNKIISKVKTKLDKLNIIYSGLVKKQNSINQIFVVTINNKQYLLKQGQVADSITLVKGNSKAITIRYKNELQTINLN
jgi:hypothetical protein